MAFYADGSLDFARFATTAALGSAVALLGPEKKKKQ